MLYLDIAQQGGSVSDQTSLSMKRLISLIYEPAKSLEAIAHLERNEQIRIRSKEIKDVYERVAIGWEYDPLTTLKSVQNHLADLTMLGFLERTEQNDGRAGGAHYQSELMLNPNIVLETREAIETDPLS